MEYISTQTQTQEQFKNSYDKGCSLASHLVDAGMPVKQIDVGCRYGSSIPSVNVEISSSKDLGYLLGKLGNRGGFVLVDVTEDGKRYLVPQVNLEKTREYATGLASGNHIPDEINLVSSRGELAGMNLRLTRKESVKPITPVWRGNDSLSITTKSNVSVL